MLKTERGTLSVESASNLPIHELHGCDVVVESPDLSLASLWKEQRTLSQTNQKLQESNTELLQTVRRLARRSARLALRCLVEEVRKKILGVSSGADLTQEQKQHWNHMVDDYTDDKLLFLGLSRADLCLTKYGGGSLQQFRGSAAHDFSKEEIAAEVMAANTHQSHLANLFLFVYGEAAEAVAFHDA